MTRRLTLEKVSADSLRQKDRALEVKTVRGYTTLERDPREKSEKAQQKETDREVPREKAKEKEMMAKEAVQTLLRALGHQEEDHPRAN